MTWENIHVDDYGWVGKLRIVQDAAAQDISSYTARQFIFRTPSNAIKTKTATFDTDGTDGVLKYTVEDGVIDECGNWRVQARISKAGAVLTSAWIKFYAEDRLDGS